MVGGGNAPPNLWFGPGLPFVQTDTLMDSPGARRRVADEVLAFADALRDR